MSQPEPCDGSEGVPQSSQDSAAPVSQSSRLNPNATAFVPSTFNVQAATFTPTFVPVYEHHPFRKPNGRLPRVPPQYLYAPMYFPDASAVHSILIEPSLNAKAQAFVPSSPILETPPVPEAVAPVEEEEEVLDPDAPLTWAQRLKLSQAKAASKPQPSKSQPKPEAKAKQPLLPTAETIQKAASPLKAENSSPRVSAAEGSPKPSPKAAPKAMPLPAKAAEVVTPSVEEAEEDAKSSSSFEEIPGVDGTRRIYSLKFLSQFRDYSDPSIPVKELIPSHLYLQPAHEDENLSWRTSRGGRSRAPAKVSGVVVEPLKRAEHSWSALQQKLKTTSAPEEDERVERAIRGLLNKLTTEKYAKLKSQLFGPEIQMNTYHQLSILVKLLFEKATQQHSFIPLYADLCRDCRDWLATPEGKARFGAEDVKDYFRVTLTEQCQQAFDSFLVVPVATIDGELNEEEVYAAAVKHRTKVWGNLKLIGQLIARRIISSKIAMKCIEEFMAQGDNETLLEALAVFLTDVARVIDTPNWDHHSKLEDVFKHLATLAYSTDKKSLSSKCKFALQNLLDLRKANWQPAALAKVVVASKASTVAVKAPPATASRSGAWKPKMIAAPVSKGALKPTSSFRGWGKPLPGVAVGEADDATKAETSESPMASDSRKSAIDEASRKSHTALEECRASRSKADAVVSLKEAMEGLSITEKISVVCNKQLYCAIEASAKDQDLLLAAVTEAMTSELLDPAEVLDHFIEGCFEELKQDVPLAPAIVRDKLLPLLSLDDQVTQSILSRLGF